MFWVLLLLVGALLLFTIDVLVPSGGLFSILGAIALIAAICVAFTQGVREGAITILIISIGVPAFAWSAARWWPHTPLGKLILVPPPEHPDDVLPESAHRWPTSWRSRAVTRTRLVISLSADQ